MAMSSPFTAESEEFVLKAHAINYTVQEILKELHKKACPVNDKDIASLLAIHEEEPRFSRPWDSIGFHQVATLMPTTVQNIFELFKARGYAVTLESVKTALVESRRSIRDTVVKFRDCGVDVTPEAMRQTLAQWKKMEDARYQQEDGWGNHTGQYIILANKLGFTSEEIAHELDGSIARISERRVNQYLTSVANCQPISAHKWDASAAEFTVSSHKMHFSLHYILHKLLSQGYYFGPDTEEGLKHILRELRNKGYFIPGFDRISK